MTAVVDLKQKLASFNDTWSPKIVGDVNDVQIKVVKLEGAFEWHHHDTEDELFFVVAGRLRMRFRDHDEVIEPGQFVIVPHGVEHLPIAEPTCEIMLIEPRSTLNTGTHVSERTVADLQRI